MRALRGDQGELDLSTLVLNSRPPGLARPYPAMSSRAVPGLDRLASPSRAWPRPARTCRDRLPCQCPTLRRLTPDRKV